MSHLSLYSARSSMYPCTNLCISPHHRPSSSHYSSIRSQHFDNFFLSRILLTFSEFGDEISSLLRARSRTYTWVTENAMIVKSVLSTLQVTELRTLDQAPCAFGFFEFGYAGIVPVIGASASSEHPHIDPFMRGDVSDIVLILGKEGVFSVFESGNVGLASVGASAFGERLLFDPLCAAQVSARSS